MRLFRKKAPDNHIVGENNRIIVAGGGVAGAVKNLCITIIGNNNVIKIADPDAFDENCRIIINRCNNNVIDIQAHRFVHKIPEMCGRIGNLTICMGFSDNQKIQIGDGTTMNGVVIYAYLPNVELNIGRDCMFSDGIEIFLSDGHTITDNDGAVLNNCKSPLCIGNHCWIGHGATIMKNAGLPDNTIVAAKSVVSKKFTESNTVVGGNPARVVKTGVNWDRRIHAEIDSIESAK